MKKIYRVDLTARVTAGTDCIPSRCGAGTAAVANGSICSGIAHISSRTNDSIKEFKLATCVLENNAIDILLLSL